jgi:hypothetical protein
MVFSVGIKNQNSLKSTKKTQKHPRKKKKKKNIHITCEKSIEKREKMGRKHRWAQKIKNPRNVL